MKKRLIFVLMLLIISSFALAGDVSSYINLGFSANSRYFMFAYYGIDDESLKPYTTIYVVDVYENKFVSNGVVSEEFDTLAQAGQVGLGALLTQLNKTPLSSIFKINHLEVGRIIYFLHGNGESKNDLEFRDFNSGNKYKVSLKQQNYDNGSSFYINLTVIDNKNQTKTYTLGLPNYVRDDVTQYRIKQILFSPDEKSLIFVVEKQVETESGGLDIRYMVETVKL